MIAKYVTAVDLGAESGRVARIGFDGSRFMLNETHRFGNTPVEVRGTLHWDVLRLWHQISTGVRGQLGTTSSIGVDTWGVDFALLDRDGKLLSNPVHYRDQRTDGVMDWVFERVPRREVFEKTGIQFMQINTLYQLAAMVRQQSAVLENAATFLTIPDLFNYWLSGSRTCEFTEVTTTQCYNPQLGDWDRELLSAIGVDPAIFPSIVQPGTHIGDYHGIPVITPATHDTGSAVVAVPTTTPDYAYLSSGTWSLLGLELDAPVISDASYDANVTNEGGANGTFRLLKNIMGLWLAQQCRETWRLQGNDYTYDTLVEMAADAEGFQAFVDPDDDMFLPPGDMPARIRAFCQQTGQYVPQTDGEVMRTIYESLAFKYQTALQRLIKVSGRAVERLHIIGGGSQNVLLCQMTANAIGLPVLAGPVEATALGNGIIQFVALGEISNIAEAREILSRTVGVMTYEPQETAQWAEAYERFTTILTT